MVSVDCLIGEVSFLCRASILAKKDCETGEAHYVLALAHPISV
jgi:hypothetical protein